MKRKMNSLLGIILVLSLVLGGCGAKGKNETPGATDTKKETEVKENDAGETAGDEIEKPEKITIMVDATLVTKPNGRDAFQAKWEELTGIKLEIIQPDHDAYSDNIGQTFASGDLPDVVLLNSSKKVESLGNINCKK